MALNTDYTKIKNYKRTLYTKLKEGEHGYDPKEAQYKIKARIEAIIFATMVVGIREITEKNYKKFYYRLHLIETVNGAWFYKKTRDKHIPMPITLEEVKKMIGLKSNASDLTLTQFMKKFKDKM